MNQQVVEALQKVSRVEDQALIGLKRASDNVKVALTILQSARQADIGPDTNAVLDELIAIATKLQAIVGSR